MVAGTHNLISSRRLLGMAVLALLAIAIFAIPAVAHAEGVSEVVIKSDELLDDVVFGLGYAPVAPVKLTLKSSSGQTLRTTETTTTAAGDFLADFRDSAGNKVEIKNGYTVSINVGVGMEMEDITIHLKAVISAQHDRVTVEAEPNRDVMIEKIAGYAYITVANQPTDSNGLLVYQSSSDLQPDEYFNVVAIDSNYNRVSADLWPAYARVSTSGNIVWAYSYWPGASATVDIFRDGVKVASKPGLTDSNGNFNARDFSAEIRNHDTVVVSVASESDSFEADLTVHPDFVAERVSGETAPSSFLVVRVIPAGNPQVPVDATATANSVGEYSAPVALGVDDEIWVASVHPDGNITQVQVQHGTESYAAGSPTIYTGKSNQDVAGVTIRELRPRSLLSGAGTNTVTLSIVTPGITFTHPPYAAASGVQLSDDFATLTPDKRTATWLVSQSTASIAGSISIVDIAFDVGADVAPGDVTLQVGGTAGATVETLSNATVEADVEAPVTVMSVNPAEPDGENGWYVTSPAITLTTDEPAITYYGWDGGEEEVEYDAPFNAPEGTHTLTYYSIDAADNTETAHDVTFKVDTTAPTVPVLSDIETITASSAGRVTVHGAAEQDTTIYVTASDGTHEATATVPSSGSFSAALDVSGFDDGTIIFTAYAEDTAGNESPASLAVTALKDTVAPEVVDTDPARDETGVEVAARVTVTLSEAIDAGAAYSGISLMAGDAAVVFTASIQDNALVIDCDDPLSYDTEYALVIPAGALQDEAGNTLAGDFELRFTTRAEPDTVAPTTSTSVEPAEPDGSDGWYATTPLIALTADETATIFYAWDGGPERAYTTPLEAPEGTHTLTFYAVDLAGNTGDSQSREFKVDAVAPIVAITADPPAPDGENGWYITAPAITLSADETATIYYRWDGEEEVEYDAPFNAPGGIHTLTSRAIDSLGNAGETTGSEFRVDTAPPLPPVVDTIDTITASNAGSFVVSGSAEPGTVVCITASDGADEVEENSPSDGSFSVTLDLSSLSDGEITFTACAKDAAGNEGDGVSTSAHKDTVAPEVVDTIPASEETNTGRGDSVTIEFDDDIVEGSTFGDISLTAGGSAVSVLTNISGNTLTLEPVASLKYSTLYTVTIPAGALEDAVGNGFAAEYRFNFTTEPDIIPPHWPTGSMLTVSSIGTASAVLVWTPAIDNVGVIGYRVYADSGKGAVLKATVGATNTATVSGLSAGTTYTFTVQAKDAAGNWSGAPGTGPAATATTAKAGGGDGTGGGGGGGTPPPDKQAPAAPQGLKVAVTEDAIDLTWNANSESDVAGYNVYRREGGGEPVKLNGTLAGKAQYRDTTALAGATYTYYVTAVDAANNESPQSDSVQVTLAQPRTITFTDVTEDSWYVPFISLLVDEEIVGGYPDGTFKPQKTVTRAEFAKMVCLAMGWDLINPGSPSFSDVGKGHWSYRYIETAKARGAISGYPDGTFGPARDITRAEIATIIAKTLRLAHGKVALSDTGAHWANSYIGACTAAGIIGGYPDGTFRPDATATRAEAARMIAGMCEHR